VEEKKWNTNMSLTKRVAVFATSVSVIVVVAITTCIDQRKFTHNWSMRQHKIDCNNPFELRKGDILIRPNNGWLPGTIAIPEGRKYGHVGIVVEGATGSSVEETLQKALIIEALFFDQKTKRFLINADEQIREEPAWTSFGHKFKGIRYRLRVPLSSTQTDSLCSLLKSQLDASYNIISLKKKSSAFTGKKNTGINRDSWHCATLTWSVFYAVTNLDIDGNGGILIYPGDIIGSKLFDEEGCRVCF
jgi:hypothetical protein